MRSIVEGQASTRMALQTSQTLTPQSMSALRPGEVILCKLFHEFTILADKKIEAVLADGEKPLAKSLQRGEDPVFDQLLTAFGSVAEHSLPSMLRILFEWHNRQMSFMAAWIEKVANGAQETTGTTGSGVGGLTSSPLPALHQTHGGGGITYSVGTAASSGLKTVIGELSSAARAVSTPTPSTSITTGSSVGPNLPSSAAATSSSAANTLQSSGLTPELAYLVEKRDLAVEFIFCLVLIEVLKQLHLHPGYDELHLHIENLAFQHFRFREDAQASPNLANINMIADLYAEVIGVLAQSHFQSVRKRFMAEFKELRQRDPGPITTHCIISLLMGMKFFRIKMAPIEELVASFQFMHECAVYFLEVKDKDIKHALAGLFVEILVPVAATVKNEVNVPCLKTFVELLYSPTMDLCTKKKHMLSVFPLVTCLLCVAQKQFFLSNWHYFLTMCLQQLKNRDAKMSRVALESLYRLLWVYMIRIKCESNSATQTRLHTIVNSLFPKGSKAVVPRDTPLAIFVKIIQFIAQEKLEFAMKEIVFDLLSVGRPVKMILTPERMSIGLRAFLVVADSLQQKDGEPPMPRSLAVLPSGNTLRVKKTFLSKMLTDEMAKNIGMNAYYLQVRKAFSEILKALDAHLGRPLMMTNGQNINKEPDEMLMGEKKPKIDLFRMSVAAIPRLIPDGISKTELIDLLARLTVHMDEELNALAFQALQNLVIDFPDWREDVVAGFVHFIHYEIEDVHQRLIETALRRLYQLMTSWKNSVQQQQQQQQQQSSMSRTASGGGVQSGVQHSNMTTTPAVTTKPPTSAKLDQIANVLNNVDGLALVMLCYCRQPTRKLAAYILKESRTISNLLLLPPPPSPAAASDNSNVMMDTPNTDTRHVRKYDEPVATIIDQHCPEIIGKCFPYISTNEKATIIALSYQIDLQWLAERTGPNWISEAVGQNASSTANGVSRQSSAASTVRSLTGSLSASSAAAAAASVVGTVSSLGSIASSVTGVGGGGNSSGIQSISGSAHAAGGRQQGIDGAGGAGGARDGPGGGQVVGGSGSGGGAMIDRKPSNTTVVASSTLLNTTTLLNESSKLLNRQDSDLSKLGLASINSGAAAGAGNANSTSATLTTAEQLDELKLNAWNVCLMELMSEVVVRCPNAVAQAWPIVCERLNSVLQLLDPNPVNDNRGSSILRSSTTSNLKRAATSNFDRNFYLELWKNYLMLTCKIAPSSLVGGPATMMTPNYGPNNQQMSMAESCASPDSSLMESRTNPLANVGAGGLGVTNQVEGNRSPILKSTQTAQSIFKKVLQKVRSEQVDLRNAAILGLAQVNSYAFADLLEELMPYLRDVMDRKQENIRRRRKREMLRFQIGQLLRIMSDRQTLFVDCPPGVVCVDRIGDGSYTLSNIFLEYIDGARHFFEAEPAVADKEANPAFLRDFRESFCHFICNLIKCFPLEARKDKMTREMRHQLFNLFVGWSQRYSNVFWMEEAAKQAPSASTADMSELEFLALKSMSAVLCAGPMFKVTVIVDGRRSRRDEPETSLLDSTNLYAWLMMLLKADEHRLNEIGLETIILLLENNLDESGALLEWLIECCYTKSAKIADACFTALVTIFSVREYPCDRYIAILVVTMINIGCPRLEIQQLASQLLQILYKRFYSYLNIGRICGAADKEMGNEGEARQAGRTSTGAASGRLESTPKKSSWALSSQRSIINKIMDFDIIDPNYTPLPSRKSMNSKTFEVEDAKSNVNIEQEQLIEPLLSNLYPCTLSSIARLMAVLHPQMTMIVFSEITFRFQTATPKLCQDLLYFLIPWLYNMQLVDPIVQHSYEDEEKRKPGNFSRSSSQNIDGDDDDDDDELYGSFYHEGWGSIESTETVLNNLFFIICKFGDDYAEAMEAVWAALSANRPNNLKIILNYLFVFVSLAPNDLLPFAKRVVIYLARAQPSGVIDQLMAELRMVEFLPFNIERTEAFPFFRVIKRKSSDTHLDSTGATNTVAEDGTRAATSTSIKGGNANDAKQAAGNGNTSTETGMLHTKRHSKDLHGMAGGSDGSSKIMLDGNTTGRTPGNLDSFPGSGASSEDYNNIFDDNDIGGGGGGNSLPGKPSTPQPRPLPMPEYGAYQAPLKEFLLNTNGGQCVNNGGWNVGFHRCNLALMLLCDLITQDLSIDWQQHVPLMLHILFLGMDHSRPIVYEHCKQLLLNLLIVTGKHEDSLRVARILLKNRVWQQNFGLSMTSFSTFPTYSLNSSTNINENAGEAEGETQQQQQQQMQQQSSQVELDLNQIFTKSVESGQQQQQQQQQQPKTPTTRKFNSNTVDLFDIQLNIVQENAELEQQESGQQTEASKGGKASPEIYSPAPANASADGTQPQPPPSASSPPKRRAKFSLDLYIKSLIDFISRKPGQQLWNYEDITAKVWSIRSAEQLSCFVEHVAFVFKESLPKHRIQTRWGEIALQLSLSCSSRHYAGRSLQIFRALKMPINTRLLSDILSRLVETISEPGEDMQGYVTELMLTLESAIDSLDFRPRNILDLINEYFHFDADIEFDETDEADIDVGGGLRAGGGQHHRGRNSPPYDDDDEETTIALEMNRSPSKRPRTQADNEEKLLNGGDINNIEERDGMTPTMPSMMPTSQSHYECSKATAGVTKPPTRSTSYSMSFPTRRYHFDSERAALLSSLSKTAHNFSPRSRAMTSDPNHRSKSNSLNSVVGLNRSQSTQSLKNIGLANQPRNTTNLEEYMTEDKNLILSQFLWISVIMLETDYEHEFQLALRVLDKVLSKLSLDDADCQEKIEKIFLNFKWHNFPGVHALLLKGCASPINYEPTINLLYKLTPYLKLAAIDPTKSEQSFPFHVMAMLPYLLQNYDDPNGLCIEAAVSFAQWCNENSNKLENLATVMTLYSKRCFSKENQQWTKCVVKYLYDAFASSFVDLVGFLVEMAERGPPLFLNHIITILHFMLNYIDLSSAATASSINNNLLRVAGRYIEGTQWREALKILKLAVTRCSSLATPAHYGSQGASSWSRWPSSLHGSVATASSGSSASGSNPGLTSSQPNEFGATGLVSGVLASEEIIATDNKWWSYDGGSLGASSLPGIISTASAASGVGRTGSRELPGRTMDFQFDLGVTPVAGLKFLRKRKTIDGGSGDHSAEDSSPASSENFTLNRLFEEQITSNYLDTAGAAAGGHAKMGPRTSTSAPPLSSSHVRMRERLIGLLNSCGLRSGLPKSPSVIFNQNSDIVGGANGGANASGQVGPAGDRPPGTGSGDHRSSMASSIEDVSAGGGGAGANSGVGGATGEGGDDADSKHDDAISNGADYFIKDFDFLEYELESQEGESLDNFNWGVRRKSLSNLEQNLNELKKMDDTVGGGGGGDKLKEGVRLTTTTTMTTMTTTSSVSHAIDGSPKEAEPTTTTQEEDDDETPAESKKLVVTISTMTAEEDIEASEEKTHANSAELGDGLDGVRLRRANEVPASNISDLSSDEEVESVSPLYEEINLITGDAQQPSDDGRLQTSATAAINVNSSSSNNLHLAATNTLTSSGAESRPASLISSYGSECDYPGSGLKTLSESEDSEPIVPQPFLRLINEDNWTRTGGEINLVLTSIFRATFKRVIMLTREACDCLQQQHSITATTSAGEATASAQPYEATAARFLELLDLIAAQIDFPFVHFDDRLLVTNPKAVERIRFVLLEMHAHWETFTEKREALVEMITATKTMAGGGDRSKLCKSLYRTYFQLFLLFECYLKFIDVLKSVVAHAKVDNRSEEIMSLRRRLLQCSLDDSLMLTLTENCHYSSTIEEGVLRRDNEEELARLVGTQQLGKAIKFVKILKVAIPDLPGEDPIETLLTLYCRIAFGRKRNDEDEVYDVEEGEPPTVVVAITEPEYNLSEITKQLMDASFIVNCQ